MSEDKAMEEGGGEGQYEETFFLPLENSTEIEETKGSIRGW